MIVLVRKKEMTLQKLTHVTLAAALALYELHLMWVFRADLTVYAVAHDWGQWTGLVVLGSWRFDRRTVEMWKELL